MVLKKIKSFFRYKKVDFVKEEIELPLKFVNNKIVEFIGVSGIGKSTLFHFAKDKLAARWEYYIPNSDFKENLFEEKITRIHCELLENKLSKTKTMAISYLSKLQLSAYFNKVLLDNLILVGNSHKGFFIEEGLCHNFPVELWELNDDELSFVLKNRFLIYVKTENPLTVVDQIKKRTSEGGHTVYHHIGLSDEQLLDLVINSMEQFESFFHKIKNSQIPVCVLMIEDGLEVNSNKILQFENKILND